MPSPLSADERENLRRILAEAQSLATSGDYTGARDGVRRAREQEPENVYVLAFEKQVEQLSLLASSNALTEEARTDILESLGGIVDRAVEVEPDEKPSGKSSGAAPVATREDRAAAMEWLKSQYFQQAHQYVRKGEYDHALAEIRRVYILEADNETARQFEAHIQEIKDLHQVVPPQARSSVVTPASPPAIRRERAGQHELAGIDKAPPSKRRSFALLVGIIAVAIAFIGFALIFNWMRSSEVQEQPPPVVIPQPEVYFSDPATPADSARAAAGIDTTGPQETSGPEPASEPQQEQ